jgi:hypothetical protein
MRKYDLMPFYIEDFEDRLKNNNKNMKIILVDAWNTFVTED